MHASFTTFPPSAIPAITPCRGDVLRYGRASPGDVPILLNGVVAGVRREHFGDPMLIFSHQIRLARLAFSAVLLDLTGTRRDGWHLVAARRHGRTLGVCLYSAKTGCATGARFDIAAFVVVEGERRKGVGRFLLRSIIDSLPRPGTVACACIEKSAGMIRLLHLEGFVLRHPSTPVLGGRVSPRIYQRTQ